nr:MAG TPA: hypothetical protein [Caudoviricetes sp.]
MKTKMKGVIIRSQIFSYRPSVVITLKRKTVMTGEKSITVCRIWD